MKKRALILLVILSLTLSSFALVGCNEDDCAHVFNLTFSYEDTNHWRECKDCGFVVEKEAHTLKTTLVGSYYEDNKVYRTLSDRCDICGYSKEYNVEEIVVPPMNNAQYSEFEGYLDDLVSRVAQAEKFSVTLIAQINGEESEYMWRKQKDPFYYARRQDDNLWYVYKHSGDNVYCYEVIPYWHVQESYICPIADYDEDPYETYPRVSCFEAEYNVAKCAFSKDDYFSFSVVALVKDGMSDWLKERIETVAVLAGIDKKYAQNAVATTTYKFESDKAQVRVEVDLLKGTGYSLTCSFEVTYDFEDFEIIDTSLTSAEHPAT